MTRLLFGLSCGAGLALALLASPARAQEASTPRPSPSDRWAARPLAIAATAGVSTPVGFFGGAIEAAPLPWWVLSAGAGASTNGLQLAAATRARIFVSRSVALGPGIGLSRGAYTWEKEGACTGLFGATCASTTKTWDHALRLNVEFGVEGLIPPTEDGFRWRTFLGVGHVLNSGAGSCSQHSVGGTGGLFDGPRIDGPSCDAAGSVIAYVGASLAYSIGL